MQDREHERLRNKADYCIRQMARLEKGSRLSRARRRRRYTFWRRRGFRIILAISRRRHHGRSPLERFA